MVLFKVYSIKCRAALETFYLPLLTTGQLHWNICGLSSAALYAGPKGQKQAGGILTGNLLVTSSQVQSGQSAAEL